MQPRREVSLSDVPALGFAIAALTGAAASLFVALGDRTTLSLALATAFVAMLALMFVQRRAVARLFVYVSIAFIVLMRGNADIARDEREWLAKLDSDTAIVSCRGVVVWRDEARHSRLSDRLWLADFRLITQDSIFDFNELRLRLSLPLVDATKIKIGDVIAFNARLTPSNEIQRRSVRELCWTLRDQHAADARLKDSETLIVLSGTRSLRGALHDARKSILDIFEKHLRPDARAVAGALLLGSREAFSDEFREELQLTGLAHLFALSGLNTGLIVSLMWLILAWLRVPGRLRYILLLLILIGYTALGLGVPSLFRSAVMAGLVITARILSRPSHPINLLLFAAAVELLFWPLHILDAGFHLSYLSMAGILTAYLALQQPLQDLLKTGSQSVRRRIADTMSSTVGALIATAPVAAMLFSRVPGIAIVINVFAIPLFSLLIVLILLMMLLDPISSSAASSVARAIEGLVGMFALLTSSSASMLGASLVTKTPFWAGILTAIVQLGAIVVSLRGRTWEAGAITLIALNLLIWPGRFNRHDSAHVLVAGTEESRVLYAQTGEINMLLGCGSEWNSHRNLERLKSVLARDGLSDVDVLVIDSRSITHIGGAPEIIAETKPEIVLDLSKPRDTRVSLLVDAAVQNSGAKLVRGEPGATWRNGEAYFKLISYDDSVHGREWTILLHDSAASIEIVNDGVLDKQSSVCIAERNVTIDYSEQLTDLEFVFSDGVWVETMPLTKSLIRLMKLPQNDKA